MWRTCSDLDPYTRSILPRLSSLAACRRLSHHRQPVPHLPNHPPTPCSPVPPSASRPARPLALSRRLPASSRLYSARPPLPPPRRSPPVRAELLFANAAESRSQNVCRCAWQAPAWRWPPRPPSPSLSRTTRSAPTVSGATPVCCFPFPLVMSFRTWFSALSAAAIRLLLRYPLAALSSERR